MLLNEALISEILAYAQNVEIAAAAASVNIEDLTVDNDLSVSRRCFNDAGLHEVLDLEIFDWSSSIGDFQQ